MKKILLLFSTLILLVSLTAQEAELGRSDGYNLLAWPFADSYHINHVSGSHGWSMVNGAGGGLHQANDFFALDWLRPGAPTCGIEFTAPLSGTVIWTEGNSNVGYGKTIVIQSDQDTTYAFRIAHLEAILVRTGNKVKAGDVIGIVGDTGNGPCHGHLALYHRIYDWADLPKTSADSAASPGTRPIDILRAGLFIPTSTSNPTYFSAPFGFLPAEDGHELIRFLPSRQEFGNRDTLTAAVQLVNQSPKVRTGTLFISLQKSQYFNYYQLLPSEKKDLLNLAPGDTVSTNVKSLLFGREPGSYYAHLILLTPDTLNGIPSGTDTATPLGRVAIELYDSNLCLRDEPNDQLSEATALFTSQLKEAVAVRTKEAYISSEDTKDVYRFTSQKLGRFDFNWTTQAGFDWQISTLEGTVDIFEEGQGIYFYTQANTTYYITIQGPPSCLRAYRFTYEWRPVNVLEWTLQPAEELVHSFEVLESVEVEWMVFDMLGRRMWTSNKRKLAVGNHQFQDEVSVFQSGIYSVVLFINDRVADNRRIYWNR